MIKQIEAEHPKFIVAFSGPGWLSGEFTGKHQTPDHILPWVKKFVGEFYKPVGVVDVTPRKTYYYWGPQAGAHPPSSGIFSVIYERKN
jgi:hypothetical protein